MGPLAAAIVSVNALGDIFDHRDGKKIAGLLTADRKSFSDSRAELYGLDVKPLDRTNTTIGAIITNGQFDKAQLTKISSMATAAYSRCIAPVGTLADGDTIYAASVGEVDSDVNVVGTLAADVMSEAIRRAIVSSQIDDAEYLANCWRP